jgi:probable rRNA maturation factor
MRRDRAPVIEVRNAQKTLSFDLRSLQSFAELTVEASWGRRRAGSDISSVPVLLVSIVSDRAMARMHKKFCGSAGSTDVLTFQHGEIIISAPTATRQARIFRTSLEDELRLYILHGLLHLCGYDDGNARERAVMEKLQRNLLKKASQKVRSS